VFHEVSLQGFAAVGMRRAAIGVVPRGEAPIAEMLVGTRFQDHSSTSVCIQRVRWYTAKLVQTLRTCSAPATLIRLFCRSCHPNGRADRRGSQTMIRRVTGQSMTKYDKSDPHR